MKCLKLKFFSIKNEESVRSAAEAESDAEDLIVESESDSDQSNQDGGQRSVQTGATAGSDSGKFCAVITEHLFSNEEIYIGFFAIFQTTNPENRRSKKMKNRKPPKRTI